eukprot:COSAG01_NODE_23259_length_821_cov_41.534626_2_plen_86_part_00
MPDIIDDVDDVALQPSILDGHDTDSSSDEWDSDEEEERVQAELARDRRASSSASLLNFDGPLLGDGIVDAVAVNPPRRRSARNRA